MTLHIVSQIRLIVMTWYVSLFGHVTDLMSWGYLVFGVGVGVRADFAQLVRCDMLLLIMYVKKQLYM